MFIGLINSAELVSRLLLDQIQAPMCLLIEFNNLVGKMNDFVVIRRSSRKTSVVTFGSFGLSNPRS